MRKKVPQTEFLNASEQQVMLTLQELQGKLGDTIPPHADIAAAMKRLGYKQLTPSAVTKIMCNLEKKGALRRTLVLVRKIERAA